MIAILAQRLVRVICPKCKHPYQPPESVLEDAGISPEVAKKATFMKGKGCNYCSKKGFRGRIGIYELMLITAKIRELIFKNASSQEIRTAAMALGMRSLYQDGMRKVLRGVTTFEEVYRVAKRGETEQITY